MIACSKVYSSKRFGRVELHQTHVYSCSVWLTPSIAAPRSSWLVGDYLRMRSKQTALYDRSTSLAGQFKYSSIKAPVGIRSKNRTTLMDKERVFYKSSVWFDPSEPLRTTLMEKQILGEGFLQESLVWFDPPPNLFELH